MTLNYDYLDYSFSSPKSFGGRSPWGVVQRYGVSLPLSFAAGDGWRLAVAPSVDLFRENGANTGESLVWGALFSGTRRFADGNLLGLGIGVYDGIEKTSVFPFLLVDWRLGERWRLINPLASGPTGPAGIELDYQFDGGWTAGVGVFYGVMRFRLSDNGPTPDGVGEERGANIPAGHAPVQRPDGAAPLRRCRDGPATPGGKFIRQPVAQGRLRPGAPFRRHFYRALLNSAGGHFRPRQPWLRLARR